MQTIILRENLHIGGDVCMEYEEICIKKLLWEDYSHIVGNEGMEFKDICKQFCQGRIHILATIEARLSLKETKELWTYRSC